MKVSVQLEFMKTLICSTHQIPDAKSHGGMSKLPRHLGPAESEELCSDCEGGWLSVRTLSWHCFPIATNLVF